MRLPAVVRRLAPAVLRRIAPPPRPLPFQLAARFPEHRIGRASYGNVHIVAYDRTTRLSIGAYCSFADGVQILLGGEHRPDWVTTYPFNVVDRRFRHIQGHPASKGDIVIGNDVWVGRGAMILSGARIGDGAVVAAGAVVTKEVPPYGIAGGNPARLIRMRFPAPTVDALLAIGWWNWDPARIERAVPYLQSGDIEAFIGAVGKGEL